MNSLSQAAFSKDDLSFMRTAIGLAARGLGRVWPNPAVGCVIVRDGRIVGRGWTQPSGRPHAETEALRRAGSQAHGSTAYVSLEPCAHTGQTPPCAVALIDAGVQRVVIAVEDPDPRVDGAGLQRLADAGLRVEIGCCPWEAEALNAGFLLRQTEKRPLFTIKSAVSLDGQTATAGGESQWITGAEARAAGHLLRYQHDAILIGSETAVADDPQLNCRLPGCENEKRIKIVLDRRLRLPLDGNLVAGAKQAPVWLVTSQDQSAESLNPYQEAGVEILVAPGGSGDAEGIDLKWLAGVLAARGLTRVLVEGGATISGSFLKHDLVDQLIIYRAPMVLGKEGRGQFNGLDLAVLGDAPRFELSGIKPVGVDQEETYIRRL